jgi:hypothetical protein
MKKSITIMGAVNTPEYGADEHNWFYGKISRELMSKIQHLQSLVVLHDVNSLAIYEYSVDSFDMMPAKSSKVTLLVDPNGRCDQWEESGYRREKQEPNSIEVSELNITSSHVYWTWTPKNSGTLCSTEWIGIQEMLDAFKDNERKPT